MKVPFKIFRGSEDSILNKPFMDGCIYVATDTCCIYMDTYVNNVAQNKIAIGGGGGNSGIYYASKTFTDTSDLSFKLDDLEGDDLPKVNDLIINYKSKNKERDGFYKVTAVYLATNTIDTEYLPVGGGGGSTQTSEGEIIITPITGADGLTTKDQGYNIDFTVHAYNNAEAPILIPGKATLVINGVTQIDVGEVVHGGSYSIPVGEYLDTNKEKNTITLRVSLNTGGIVDNIATYTWLVKCINLKLTWDWTYSSNRYLSENEFSLNWTVSGGVANTTHISFDDGTTLNKDYFKIELASTDKEKSATFTSLPYGAHKVTMWATTTIGLETIPTDKISHVLTFIRGESTSPILTVPYFNTKAVQYETLYIPFLIYRPNTDKVKLSFFVDDVFLFEDEYNTSASELYYWPYTLSRAGEVKLKIMVSNFPSEYFETIINTSVLNLGINEPIANFSLKASNISSNAQLLAYPGLTFSSNFDWENGGLKSEINDDGVITNYICVRQGTTMTIDYKLFENTQVGIQGKTFKFCFKAMNCYEYDAPVLTCYDENSELGLIFTAQQATFSSRAQKTFSTQYCEGSYIELETEIWKNVPDKDTNRPGDRFLMFWVDGVPANVTTFTEGTSFIQNKLQNITIGSDKCDVYVYVVKVYERQLSEIEHINNFILDAPNTQEKLDRFERNDILGTNNDISYEKLVTKNPGCHAYLYKLNETGMTVGTDDDNGDQRYCDYTEYYESADKPYITAKNVMILAQGTSSAAYGIAAFNLRTDFGDTTMYDGDGNELEGRKVSPTSIPVDYACTKVNVASCEGVNNALNQEWYNRYQPYHDGHRRKQRADGNVYRDCMEFDYGVVFIEDHNPNTSYFNDQNKPSSALYLNTNLFAYDLEGNRDTDYTNKPYYKLYAVGNMGNDKKNRSIFHDQNNEKACCVEVADNQNAQHWMTHVIDYENLDREEWDYKIFKTDDDERGFYEFRYSIEKTKVKNPTVTLDDQKKAFLRLVNWMASCDPKPKSVDHPHGYTNEKLPQPVTFPVKEFRGFTPPGYEGQPNPVNEQYTLKGVTISKYAKEYTHDTEEYRIAKMLHECEDYLVMDSVVYHYLFIQRHTMVDNVAKNTFWSTEDLEHWDLTKNYDNDTSDGNDNSGYLTYGYGNEIMDKRNGEYIFNASESVWLNFIYHIPEVQEALYNRLSGYSIDGYGPWDARGYLQLFKEKQALIPERCRVRDYFRKYLRPRRLGLDSDGSFLQRLEGGVKTHQRQQFETYHGYYIDSKYCSGESFNDTSSLDMRLNRGKADFAPTKDTSPQPNKLYYEKKIIQDVTDTKIDDYFVVSVNAEDNPAELGYYELISGGWTKAETFPTSYYISLYPSAKIGGQLWRSNTRLPRASTINIPVGELLDSPADATCYIYAADMIQSIKGISDTYPNYISISKAAKLRDFEVGSLDENYNNPKLNRATINANTMLESAQMARVGSNNLVGLDLSNLHMLKELILTGSKFPELTLAKNGIIHTLHLNPLRTFVAKGLSKLTDFKYDPDIKTSLKTICIQDTPILNDFGYWLVKQNNISQYCFNGIEWITSTDDPTEFEKKADGKWHVLVLDNLLARDEDGDLIKLPTEVNKVSLALSGKLKIVLPDSLAQHSVNEYDVYAQYKSSYPQLNIEYEGNVDALQKAINIQFYNDYNTETQKYENLVYEVKTNGALDIGFLTSTNGPTGIPITAPQKDADDVNYYEWNETWIDCTDNNKVYRMDELATYIPTKDTIFKAGYDIIPRTYTITLRDDEGNTIEHNIPAQTYNTDITDLMPFYLYKPHTAEHRRYEFQGWISAQDYVNNVANPEYITKFIITKDTTYYAVFEEQDCLTKASRKEYFTFNTDGTKISLNKKYVELIQEPITLPLKNNGIDITTIGEFTQTSKDFNIPAIYFLEKKGISSSYTTIAASAFKMDDQKISKLQHIYLPSTITTIENYAFFRCKQLKTVNLTNAVTSIGTQAFYYNENVEINGDEVFSNLAEINTAAFNNAKKVVLTTLPSCLTQIGGYGFSNCPNVTVQNFTQVTTIGGNAFENAGANANALNIVLPENLTGYANGCFNNYAKDHINSITLANGGVPSSEKLAAMGLTVSNPTTIEQVIE